MGDAYVTYMDTVVGYYQAQTQALFSRPIRHVLLLHASPMNAERVPQVFALLRRRGFRFVGLDRALGDPAYRSPDRYSGPAGISWLHQWAITRGKRGPFFAGEPDVLAWVAAAAREPQPSR